MSGYADVISHIQDKTGARIFSSVINPVRHSLIRQLNKQLESELYPVITQLNISEIEVTAKRKINVSQHVIH